MEIAFVAKSSSALTLIFFTLKGHKGTKYHDNHFLMHGPNSIVLDSSFLAKKRTYALRCNILTILVSSKPNLRVEIGSGKATSRRIVRSKTKTKRIARSP